MLCNIDWCLLVLQNIQNTICFPTENFIISTASGSIVVYFSFFASFYLFRYLDCFFLVQILLLHYYYSNAVAEPTNDYRVMFGIHTFSCNIYNIYIQQYNGALNSQHLLFRMFCCLLFVCLFMMTTLSKIFKWQTMAQPMPE